MAVYPLLALLWALVLVPPLVRRRADNRAEFPEFDRMRLSFVGSSATVTHPGEAATPVPVRRSATHRRRRVLALIGASMVATLVVALVMQTKVAWGMHLLVYDILIAYVGLLARASNRQAVRRPAKAPVKRSLPDARVHRIPRTSPLPARLPAPQPALLQAASR